MKTIHLVGKYPRFKVSRLSRSDYPKFSKLLKGGNYDNDVLYIVPIDVNCVYSCRGFSIEHHQVFFSGDYRGVGSYYLVFRAEHFHNSYCASLYSHYCFEVFNADQLLYDSHASLYFGLKRLTPATYNEGYDWIDRRELILPR